MERTESSDNLLTEAAQKDSDNKSLLSLQESLEMLRRGKPVQRSEKSRRYAVAITQLEQVFAYVKVYIVDESSTDKG